MTSFSGGGSGGGGPADTDALAEGVVNLYATEERAQDAIGYALQSTPTVTPNYDDDGNLISFDVNENSSLQQVEVKFEDSSVGVRKTLNFHAGSNISFDIQDDSGDDEVDITVDAESGSPFIATGDTNPGTAPTATDSQSIAFGDDVHATTGGFVAGYGSYADNNGSSFGRNAISNDNGIAIGTANANTNGIAIGIQNNTSSYGAQGASSIAMGPNTLATGANSISMGVNNNSIGDSSVALGNNNTPNANQSVGLGGYTSSTVDAVFSVATGFESVTTLPGAQSHASGRFDLYGDCQTTLILVKQSTTNAITNRLYILSNSGNLILLDNTSWAFEGQLMGRQDDGTTSVWDIKGSVKRGAGAATIALVGTPLVTLAFQDAGASLWGTPTIGVDTADGSLDIEVTGQAATNIRWAAKLRILEVGY